MALSVTVAFSYDRGGDYGGDRGGQSGGGGGGRSSGGGSHDGGGGSSGGGSRSGGSDRGGGSSGGGGWRGGSDRGGSSGGGWRGGSDRGGSSSGGWHGGSSGVHNYFQNNRGGGSGDGGGQQRGGGGSGDGGGQQHGGGDLGRGGGGGDHGGGGGSNGGGNQGGGNNRGGGGGSNNGGDNSGGGWGGGSNSGGGGWGGSNGPTHTVSGPGSQRGGSWDADLSRKNSHSGTDHYGGSNNVLSSGKLSRPSFGNHVPANLRSGHEGHDFDKGNLIHRKDHPVLISGGYRVGYYFYTPLWCDDYFWYPFYIFDPWGGPCFVSPWYYYPCLPPYVAWNRCHVYNLPPWSEWYGDVYDYRPSYYGGDYGVWSRGHRSEIDYAVDDIVASFERDDKQAAGRLISTDLDVAIYIDGKYSYTVNAKDFYDMFLDATQNTKTRKYEITRVETGHDEAGRDIVRVNARHDYEDPWGQVTTVDHFYELRYEGRNLVIDKFGVSGQ